MYLVKAKAVVSKLRRQVKQFESRAVGRSENLGGGGGRAQSDWVYEFPDRTGLDTQICKTGPAGPDTQICQTGLNPDLYF